MTKKITNTVAQSLIALISQPRLDYVQVKQLFDNHPELGRITHNGKIIYQKTLSYRCKTLWEDNRKFTEIVNLPIPVAPVAAQPVTSPLIYNAPAGTDPKRTFIIEIANNDELNKFIALTASLSNTTVKAVA